MVKRQYDPADQGKRRKRALLSQQQVGDCFTPRVSDSAISDYETGKHALPYEFTPEDYEAALSAAIHAKAEKRARKTA